VGGTDYLKKNGPRGMLMVFCCQLNYFQGIRGGEEEFKNVVGGGREIKRWACPREEKAPCKGLEATLIGGSRV